MGAGLWRQRRDRAGLWRQRRERAGPWRQNKLKNSKVTSATPTCSLNWEGIFAIVGYSRYRGAPDQTHGWIQFGAGCRSMDQKLAAVKVMLNCMGFYMAEEEPASGGTAGQTGGTSSSSQPASGGATGQTGGASSSRQPASGGVYDKRGPPEAMDYTTSQWLADLVAEVEQWGGHLSRDLVVRDGVRRFTGTQLGFQDNPSGHCDQTRWPLAAWNAEQKWLYVKDLLGRHGGEVRELWGVGHWQHARDASYMGLAARRGQDFVGLWRHTRDADVRGEEFHEKFAAD